MKVARLFDHLLWHVKYLLQIKKIMSSDLFDILALMEIITFIYA